MRRARVIEAFLLSFLVGVAVIASWGCVPRHAVEVPVLASTELVTDVPVQALRRIGIMPFRGRQVSRVQSQAFQLGFHHELLRVAPYELVLLNEQDLMRAEGDELSTSTRYRSRRIVELARRYELDAVLFGTVTEQQFAPPQVLSLSVDLLAGETGTMIRSSSVHLDATDRRVIDGLELFYGSESRGEPEGVPGGWKAALVSPELFARFAAHQIARTL